MDAKADLSLRLAHSHFVFFFHAAAQLCFSCIVYLFWKHNFLSFFTSSWCDGLAAACDCGTSCTFHLTFFLQNIGLFRTISQTHVCLESLWMDQGSISVLLYLFLNASNERNKAETVFNELYLNSVSHDLKYTTQVSNPTWRLTLSPYNVLTGSKRILHQLEFHPNCRFSMSNKYFLHVFLFYFFHEYIAIGNICSGRTHKNKDILQ